MSKALNRETKVENRFWQYLKFFAKIKKLKKAFGRKSTFDLSKFGIGSIYIGKIDQCSTRIPAVCVSFSSTSTSDNVIAQAQCKIVWQQGPSQISQI